MGKNCWANAAYKPANKSWRVEETYIRAKGRGCYLYRAIDSTGATIDCLQSALRDAGAAKRLFRKALTDRSPPQPRVINTGQASICGSAIPGIKKIGFREFDVARRTIQGYGAVHLTGKGKVRWLRGDADHGEIRFIHKIIDLAACR